MPRFCFSIFIILFLASCSPPLPLPSSHTSLDARLSPVAMLEINPEDHLEILAVSGGGHRAAHYAIGMILALNDIPLNFPDASSEEKNLLDQIDVVSSVSGGSYGVATYFAAYIQELCKTGKSSSNALEILKKNRTRLHHMASAWGFTIIQNILNPIYWHEDLRSIDNLEEDFLAELTKIENCRDIPLLHTGHLAGYGPFPPPFVHIVNATNSKTGRVFSFNSDTDYGENYKKIKCIYWRGHPKSIQHNQIPYSLALASSAAFPPIFSDGIFGKSEKCENEGYLRLTDGGQADDNGLDTAREYARKWLAEKKDSEDARAFVLSLDAMVDGASEFATTKNDESIMSVLIERNADLPRFSKKRRHKLDLNKNDQIKESVEWENYSGGKALFGASVNFTHKAGDDKNLKALKFSSPPSTAGSPSANEYTFENYASEEHSFREYFSDEYASKRPTKGSNISTFDNFWGLKFDQQLKGVAEGYYQTSLKFLKQDTENLFKQKAESVAFDLYCANETNSSVNSKCQTYFENNMTDIKGCFTLTKDQGYIAENCQTTQAMPATQQQSIIVFNNVQEQVLEKDLRRKQDRIVTDEAGKIDTAYADFLKISRTNIKTKLTEFNKQKTALLRKAGDVHFSVIKKITEINSFDPNTIKGYVSIHTGLLATNDYLFQKTELDSKLKESLKNTLKKIPSSLKTIDFETLDLDVEKSTSTICKYILDVFHLTISITQEEKCAEELSAENFKSLFLKKTNIAVPKDAINDPSFFGSQKIDFSNFFDKLDEIKDDTNDALKEIEGRKNTLITARNELKKLAPDEKNEVPTKASTEPTDGTSTELTNEQKLTETEKSITSATSDLTNNCGKIKSDKLVSLQPNIPFLVSLTKNLIRNDEDSETPSESLYDSISKEAKDLEKLNAEYVTQLTKNKCSSFSKDSISKQLSDLKEQNIAFEKKNVIDNIDVISVIKDNLSNALNGTATNYPSTSHILKVITAFNSISEGLIYKSQTNTIVSAKLTEILDKIQEEGKFTQGKKGKLNEKLSLPFMRLEKGNSSTFKIEDLKSEICEMVTGHSHDQKSECNFGTIKTVEVAPDQDLAVKFNTSLAAFSEAAKEATDLFHRYNEEEHLKLIKTKINDNSFWLEWVYDLASYIKEQEKLQNKYPCSIKRELYSLSEYFEYKLDQDRASFAVGINKCEEQKTPLAKSSSSALISNSNTVTELRVIFDRANPSVR